MRQPNIAMEDSRKKEFEDYITKRFPPGSKRSTSCVVYAAFGAAGYKAGRYALTEYMTRFKAGWGATNGCNPVSRLRIGLYERGVDLEVEGVRYMEMHRGPAAYVLGPPPSRSRDLELEGGVIACHVDYVYEPQDCHVRGTE